MQIFMKIKLKCMIALGVAFNIFIPSQLWASPLYTGEQANEAKISFTAYVDIDSNSQPSKIAALAEIQNQLRYLIGPMFQGAGGPKASPWTAPDLTINSIELLPNVGSYRIAYSYSGKMIVEKKATHITLFLPINPEHFSTKVLKKCRFGAYVWYSWYPGYCGTREDVDYLALDITLEIIPNTVITYPEYKRLVNSNGEIKISVFVGSNHNQNPAKDDQFKSEYATFDRWLREEKFKVHELTREEMQQRLGNNGEWLPIMIEYTKDVGPYHMNVDLFYGNIASDGNSKAFHTEYLRALSGSSVVIYAGHSGLGENLDFSLFQGATGNELSLNPHYQIFMFDSCLSYTHYGSLYISSKPKGSIDFIGVGVEAYLGGRGVSLIRMIEDWSAGKTERLSYQSLASLYPNYLFGVAEDQDNPTEMSK
jgi:hypothetical protein